MGTTINLGIIERSFVEAARDLKTDEYIKFINYSKIHVIIKSENQNVFIVYGASVYPDAFIINDAFIDEMIKWQVKDFKVGSIEDLKFSISE